MARRYADLDEAIAKAKQLYELTGDVYIVRVSWNKFSVVLRNSQTRKGEVVWKPASRLKTMGVPNDPQIAEMLATMKYKEVMAITGFTKSQLCHAKRVYGWSKKQKAKAIDVEHMRESLLTMSVRDYANSVGVFPTRIYQLCRENGIKPSVAVWGRPRFDYGKGKAA